MGDLLGLGGYGSEEEEAEDSPRASKKTDQEEPDVKSTNNLVLLKQRSPGLSGLLGYEAGDDAGDEARQDIAALDSTSISPGLFTGLAAHNGLAGLWNSAGRNGNNKEEGTPTGQLGQGTPTGIRFRNPALRIISKSATPVCSSPVLANQTSDVEEGNSDTDMQAAATSAPSQVRKTVSLPPPPTGIFAKFLFFISGAKWSSMCA